MNAGIIILILICLIIIVGFIALLIYRQRRGNKCTVQTKTTTILKSQQQDLSDLEFIDHNTQELPQNQPETLSAAELLKKIQTLGPSKYKNELMEQYAKQMAEENLAYKQIQEQGSQGSDEDINIETTGSYDSDDSANPEKFFNKNPASPGLKGLQNQ